jgi:hypothetical protein
VVLAAATCSNESTYGYRDEDYLKLKIVAAFLPPLTQTA